MSWHFSQGEEAAFWEENSLDGAPSALLKLLPIAGNDFYNANAKDICRHSPSGMTLRHSTGGHGMDSLMWFLGDSPVRTYLPPAEAQESAGAEADCGPTLPGSLAKHNPASYGWKTHQCLLFGGLMSFAETWPRWGMMHDGELFPLPMPSGLNLLREVISRHLTTFGRESGFVQRAPTPKASPSGPDYARANRTGSGGDDLATAVARVPTPRSEDSQCAGGHRDKDDTLYGLICKPKTMRIATPISRDWKSTSASDATMEKNSRPLSEQVLRMPTPRAQERCQHNSQDNGMALSAAVRVPTLHGFSKDGKSNGPSGNELGRTVNRMPTPVGNEGRNRREPNGVRQIGLETAVKRVPTPTVACAMGGQTSRGGERKNELLLAGMVGGSLNPDWVEWLHGWPIGWTASAPLATDKFRQWLRWHGQY